MFSSCFRVIKMSFSLIVSFIFLLVVNINVNAYKSYSQHQLWRLNVTNDEQVKQLIDFRRKSYEHNINFWSEDVRINIPVNFLSDYFILFN